MFAFLSGQIQLKTEKYIILEANGVGFKVFCSARTLSKLPQSSGQVKVFTHLSIKETGWELYGFLTHKELELFELLISISGIGPKTALTILGDVSVDDLEEAIVLGDETILDKVSGIGKKMAQRIILELKSKVKKLTKGVGEESKLVTDIEAIDALVALGYRVSEARQALQKVPATVKGIEARIKEALKRLGKK